MPRQHFACPSCGASGLITYATADVDDPTLWPPPCRYCTERLVKTPRPGDFAMDAREPFQRFEVTRSQPIRDPETGQWGVGEVRETIDSVHKLRAIEEDSLQRYRNGEGEPIRFRRWAQDDSNYDVHSFGPPPNEQPSEEGKRRFGLTAGASALGSGDGAPPDIPFGPGVHEGNASALKGGL